MRLRALRLWNVRKFGNRGIAIEDIGDGVNVLSAENEYGKSTSFDALHALFFQPHSGTPKAVQSLRPYSGGSPQIEVDLETDQGKFRIHKQYYSGRRALVTEISSGQIVAQADEAEAWIADLLRGGASGPTGLLWVQQGATDIGAGSPREKDDERKAREDVLTSVTGDEVELLTGGRRMVRVSSKTTASLERLVTNTGMPKTGGPFKEALNELEKLQGEEENLLAQIDELRTALDDRRRKTNRLKELNDLEALEKRNQDKAQTLEALEKAKAHADKLAIAERDEKLAAGKRQTAAERHANFEEQLVQLARLKQELIDDEAGYVEALRIRDEASNTDEQARSNLEKLAAELELARSAVEEARSIQKAQQAASELIEVKDRLTKAESARGRIETLTAELDVLAMSEEAIESLEQLERDIAVFSAGVLSESVTLKIDYVDGKHGKITRDGTPIGGGKQHKLTSTEMFEIPDVGGLTISPGSGTSSENSQSSLKKAKDALRRSLANHGVENILEAKNRQRIGREKTSTLREAEVELVALAPEGIDALRRRYTDLEAKAESVGTQEIDLDEAEAKLASSLSENRDAQTQREISRSRLEGAQSSFIRLDVAITAAREEHTRMESDLGPEGERTTSQSALKDALRGEAASLAAATKTADLLRADAPDLESLVAAASRASSTVKRAQVDGATLENDIAELNGRIIVSAGNAVEETYEEVKGKRVAMEVRIAVFEREVAALMRLKQALDSARVAAKEQYFKPVMAELKPLLTLLLDEASITFDESTLLPQSLARNGQDEDIAVLSGGMREQLAILTRLAFARLLARGGHAVPVILDDALVYSDDNRIERMFNALHRQANDLQILVLTCRQRAFERLGGNGLRMIEWKPQS